MSVSIDTTDVRLILPALRDVQARLLRAQGVTNGLLDLEGAEVDTLSDMALAAAARYCNKQAPDPDHLQGIKLAVDGGVERIATAIEYCEQVSAGVGNFPCTQVLLAPK